MQGSEAPMAIRSRHAMTSQDWDALDAGVQKKFPGLRAVRHEGPMPGQDATSLAPDAGTPDLEALREKYLGASDEPARRRTRRARPEETDEDAIVTFEDPASDPRDPAGRGKTLIVNRDGDVLGAQG